MKIQLHTALFDKIQKYSFQIVVGFFCFVLLGFCLVWFLLAVFKNHNIKVEIKIPSLNISLQMWTTSSVTYGAFIKINYEKLQKT